MIFQTIVLFITLIFTFGYLFSWVKFQKYQFLEENLEIIKKNPSYHRLWHVWKGVNQAVWFLFMAMMFGAPLALVNVAVFWLLFDGLMNTIVLNKDFFFVGTTSLIDRSLRSITNLLNKLTSRVKITITPGFLAFILKALLTAGSLVYFY